MAVDRSVMLDRWILPISERRSWIILRIASSNDPISPGASLSHVTVRSPEATRSVTNAASRIGRVIVRASQSAPSDHDEKRRGRAMP